MNTVAQKNSGGKPAHRLEVAYVGNKDLNPRPFFVVRYSGGRSCEFVIGDGFATVYDAVKAGLEAVPDLPLWLPNYWLDTVRMAAQIEEVCA